MEGFGGGKGMIVDERERAPFDEEGEPSESSSGPQPDRGEPAGPPPGDSDPASTDEDGEALQEPGEER